MELTVVLEPGEDGSFAAFVPSLPGCISGGKSKNDALQAIREAVELYLETDEADLKDLKPGTMIDRITV